jgi:hypothetical protein
MTTETKKEIVKILFSKKNKFFFNKLEDKIEANITESQFIIKNRKDVDSSKLQNFELKDEFKELLLKLSLPEILQILNANGNDDVKSIKKWVTFFGVILIIEIVVGLIAALAIFG